MNIALLLMEMQALQFLTLPKVTVHVTGNKHQGIGLEHQHKGCKSCKNPITGSFSRNFISLARSQEMSFCSLGLVHAIKKKKKVGPQNPEDKDG